MKFYAKYKEYQLCVRPGRTILVGSEMAKDDGVYVYFHDHMYETKDEKLIDQMMHHPEFSPSGLVSEQFPFCISGNQAAPKEFQPKTLDCTQKGCDFKAKDSDALTLHTLTHTRRRGRKPAVAAPAGVAEGV